MSKQSVPQEHYEMPTTIDVVEGLLDNSLPQVNAPRPESHQEQLPISQTYPYKFVTDEQLVVQQQPQQPDLGR